MTLLAQEYWMMIYISTKSSAGKLVTATLVLEAEPNDT
jgi:hypothetical protein